MGFTVDQWILKVFEMAWQAFLRVKIYIASVIEFLHYGQCVWFILS